MSLHSALQKPKILLLKLLTLQEGGSHPPQSLLEDMMATDKQLKVEGDPGTAITPAPSCLPTNLCRATSASSAYRPNFPGLRGSGFETASSPEPNPFFLLLRFLHSREVFPAEQG